jgi:hypothetical protein
VTGGCVVDHTGDRNQQNRSGGFAESDIHSILSGDLKGAGCSTRMSVFHISRKHAILVLDAYGIGPS